MLGMQAKAMHRLASKPRLQALDKPCPRFVLDAGTLEQVARSTMPWNEILGLDPNRLDRPDELECKETLAQQLHEPFYLSTRRSEHNVQDGWIGVTVQKNQQEAPNARLARGEQAFQLYEQPPCGEQHSFRMRNLPWQLELRGET